eukprot:scpid6902/ scgid14384/ 
MQPVQNGGRSAHITSASRSSACAVQIRYTHCDTCVREMPTNDVCRIREVPFDPSCSDPVCQRRACMVYSQTHRHSQCIPQRCGDPTHETRLKSEAVKDSCLMATDSQC